jgi:multidrug efflux system outer membrane protein
MIKKWTLTVIAASFVAGCSMAPTYQRPEAPVASVFPSSAEKTSAKSAVDIGWREFFRDARLQALIATALEHNRDLKIAVLRIEEARSLYNIQWADRLPNLNATATGSRGRTPTNLSMTGGGVGSRYDVGISLASFELDFFGRVKSLNDAALASYLASEEAQRSAQISLVAEVAKAYLAERAYAEQFELAQKSYATRESS